MNHIFASSLDFVNKCPVKNYSFKKAIIEYKLENNYMLFSSKTVIVNILMHLICNSLQEGS